MVSKLEDCSKEKLKRSISQGLAQHHEIILIASSVVLWTMEMWSIVREIGPCLYLDIVIDTNADQYRPDTSNSV